MSIKASHIFQFSAVAILLTSWILDQDISFDAKTFTWSGSLLKIGVWASLILFLFSLGYRYFERTSLNPLLTKVHVSLTLLGMGLLYIYVLGWINAKAVDILALVVSSLAIGVTAYLVNLSIALVVKLLAKDI